MDSHQEDFDALNEKVDELNSKVNVHKEKIVEIFKDMRHPKRDYIMTQFDEILKTWKQMLEIQGIVINTLEQETLMNFIEVIGLPEEYGQDLRGVASILSKLLHIRVSESHVVGFKRIDNVEDPPEFDSGNPRKLVVELINQNIKKRILTVADFVVLNVVGSDRPMYIIEHLTKRNHELLRKARLMGLEHNINNVWAENGKILVKWSDTSLVYEVRCDADIEKLAHF